MTGPMKLPKAFEGTVFDSFVRTFAESVWVLAECCPEQGTDPDAINDWYELMSILAHHMETAARLSGWSDGESLASDISFHLQTKDRAPREQDGATAQPFWDELMGKAAAMGRAAQHAWPELHLDDDGEPIP